MKVFQIATVQDKNAFSAAGVFLCGNKNITPVKGHYAIAELTKTDKKWEGEGKDRKLVDAPERDMWMIRSTFPTLNAAILASKEDAIIEAKSQAVVDHFAKGVTLKPQDVTELEAMF